MGYTQYLCDTISFEFGKVLELFLKSKIGVQFTCIPLSFHKFYKAMS